MKQLTFRLKPGQLLKEQIEKRINGVKAGVLLSIVGSLKNAYLRMAGAAPDNQIVKSFEEPLEIVSGTGTISQEGRHIHISVSNKKSEVIGGHLKKGCQVATTVEVVIGIFDDISYKRIYDKSTGYKELKIESLGQS